MAKIVNLKKRKEEQNQKVRIEISNIHSKIDFSFFLYTINYTNHIYDIVFFLT